ncbi:MAG: DciA family protein [Candidatus Kaistia colombiensis]|nr:MAG: DciA family protein [Kaistia sp.]
MSDNTNPKVNRGAQSIGALIGSVIAPVCAKRGFATADLISAWADIVGPRYATTTLPEKITWPRRDQTKAPAGATLVIRVDSGMAIYLQHETGVVLDRINGFLGFGAVSQLKIVQGVVSAPRKTAAVPAPLSRADEALVADTVASVESDGLREALARLGRGVYGSVRRP